MNEKKKKGIVILLGILLMGLLFASHIMALATSSEPVEVSGYSQFASAVINANDGDTIIITGQIDILGGRSFEDPNKHVIIKRGNAEAKINLVRVEGGHPIRLSNFTFDGNRIESNTPFFEINHSTNFSDVTFKNIVTTMLSPLSVHYGEVNFQNCKFDNNKGFNGGHISSNSSAIVNIKDSELKNGQAENSGGAISNISTSSTLTITSSIITENKAGNRGGAIVNGGIVNIAGSKIYNNKAVLIADDIANSEWGSLTFEDSYEDLVKLYAPDGILPIGWVHHDYVGGNDDFLRFEYEFLPTKVILLPSSLGIAGNEKITDLEVDKHYKITVNNEVYYLMADGSLTTNETDAEKLTGTEIIGLINGVIYLVEEYIPLVEEEPEIPNEEPTDPKEEEEEPDKEEPKDEEDSTNQEPKDDEVEEDHDKNSSSSTTNNTTNSNNKTDNTVNDITNHNSESRDESSTVNNYSYDQSTHTTTEKTYIPSSRADSNGNNEKGGQGSTNQYQQPIIIDRGKVTDGMKVQEDGQNITINVNVNVQAEEKDQAEPQPEKEVVEVFSSNVEAFQPPPGSINISWIDLVKIILLIGILISVIRRPMTK